MNSTPDERARVVAQLQHLEKALVEGSRDVRTKANGHHPAVKQPTEILSQIFLECAQNDPTNAPGTQGRPGQQGWLAVTAVCQRWRNVSVACNPLWATAFPQAFGREVSWAARAGEHPLTIHSFAVSRDRRSPRVATLLPYFPRASSITVRANIDLDKVHHALSSSPHPRLYQLELRHVGTRDVNPLVVSAQLPPIQATSLRDAIFYNFLVPLTAPALTSFHLHNTYDVKRIFEVDVLLTVLAALPSLEDLAVFGFTWATDDHPATERQVFPNMQKLVVSGPSTVHVLLDHLSLSCTCEVNANLTDGRLLDRDAVETLMNSARECLIYRWHNNSLICLILQKRARTVFYPIGSCPYTTPVMECTCGPRLSVSCSQTGLGMPGTKYCQKPRLSSGASTLRTSTSGHSKTYPTVFFGRTFSPNSLHWNCCRWAETYSNYSATALR